MKLLVVEDERDMSRILIRELKKEGYLTDACFDGESALYYLEYTAYDGVILDVMLPKLDGFGVLKEARRRGIRTPVLFLTARDGLNDIVRGLDLGASDYLIKPFRMQELLARVRVMTRMRPERTESIYTCGDLTVNETSHVVTRAGKVIELSPKEYSVLLYLIRNQGLVLTREQIESDSWDVSYGGGSNVVDVYIRFLRKKIDDEFDKKLIRTVRGVGYLLKDEG